MLRSAFSLALAFSTFAGRLHSSEPGEVAPRPRLVVVIAIDQLRPDYLQRFGRYFSKDGFNLLLRAGATFTYANNLHSITHT